MADLEKIAETYGWRDWRQVVANQEEVIESLRAALREAEAQRDEVAAWAAMLETFREGEGNAPGAPYECPERPKAVATVLGWRGRAEAHEATLQEIADIAERRDWLTMGHEKTIAELARRAGTPRRHEPHCDLGRLPYDWADHSSAPACTCTVPEREGHAPTCEAAVCDCGEAARIQREGASRADDIREEWKYARAVGTGSFAAEEWREGAER